MHIAEQIEALNPQPGEHFSANYILGSQDMVSVVLTPDLIPSYVESLPPTADIWIGVNPVDPRNIPPGKRGKASDVTRLAALFADLDVKDGACANLGVAEDIIDDLSGLLGETPTYMVYTGHGIHPVWTVDPDTTLPNADLAALLKRWGQLVKLVAKRRGAQADSVFDLARILRAAGTRNNKDDVPIDVAGVMGSGGPLTLDQIDERLREQGIEDAPPVDPAANVTVADAGWAHTECHYCTKAFEAWATEIPGERHPRLINWFTRLESMRRLGCLTYAQYQRGAKIAADRFTVLCEQGIGGKPRAVKPFEIEDCLDWGAARAAAKSAAELALEVGKHEHDIIGGILNRNAAQAISAPVVHISDEMGDDEKPDLFRHIFAAEDDFWSATASLKQIYETSMARMVSPWAVLAYCAARILYLVPSSVELPGLVGPRGSLNWFSIVVDKSGGGKSAAASVAKELVSPMFPIKIKEKNPGSGEGMIDQFFDPPVPPATKPTRREAVMFTTDEIDALTAMSQRQGGTTLSVLRTAFSGGTLGFSYVTKGRNVHIEEHSYRMTLVINAQPARCGALLADHGGGTPQRFMWFPANDLRPSAATADENHVPPAIPLPHGMALLGRKRVQIPSEARDLIIATREHQLHGNTDALDGHALFCREKFAYALALLDGRVDMGAEDWRLSGIAAEVSSRTRAWVQSELERSMEVEAKAAGKQRGITFAAADEEKSHQQAKMIRTVQDWVLKRLKDKGIQKTRELTQACASRSRAWLKVALDGLLADELVIHDVAETTWRLPDLS